VSKFSSPPLTPAGSAYLAEKVAQSIADAVDELDYQPRAAVADPQPKAKKSGKKKSGKKNKN
jgi:hypothetical protein